MESGIDFSVWVSVIMAVVGALSGVVIVLIKVIGDHWAKKIDRKLELKSLTDEVNRMTSFVSQSRSFEMMDYASRVDAIVESVLDYTVRKDIKASKTEIQLLVESSFSSLKSLENTGLKLYKLKQSEEHNGSSFEK